MPPEDSFVGVVTLPVWRGQVLLIRYFRHATRNWHLDIPRGFGMAADPRESARRELAEEIGATDVQLTELGESYPDSGMDCSRVAFFHAEVGTFGQPEQHEGIKEILPTPLADFERMIRDGELHDGFLLTAYGFAEAKNLI